MMADWDEKEEKRRCSTKSTSLFSDDDEEEEAVDMDLSEEEEEEKPIQRVPRRRRKKEGENGGSEVDADKDVNTTLGTLRRSRSAIEAEVGLMRNAALRASKSGGDSLARVPRNKSDPCERRDMLTRQTSTRRMRMLATGQLKRQESMRMRKNSSLCAGGGDAPGMPCRCVSPVRGPEKNSRGDRDDDDDDNDEEEDIVLSKPTRRVMRKKEGTLNEEGHESDDNMISLGKPTRSSLVNSEEEDTESESSASFRSGRDHCSSSPKTKPRRRLVRRVISSPIEDTA